MRLRLLLNFRTITFKTQYVGLSHVKATRRRNNQFLGFSASTPPHAPVYPFPQSNVLSSSADFRFLKLVLTTRVDWLTGDVTGLYSHNRALYPKFTPNQGKRVLRKGFDTRLTSFKHDSVFFDARRVLGLVPKASESVTAEAGFVAASTGTIKYKAKTWGTYLYNSNFFLGQWARLYRLNYIRAASLPWLSYSTLCFNLQRIDYTWEAFTGYTSIVDPRSSLQHVFTATITEVFRKQLFLFFGEMFTAIRGCNSLSLMPQYHRNGVFAVLPGNQLSSVYNREPRSNTAILSWFVGLNAEAYLPFFTNIVLARPGFGGGWSTSYTVTSSIDDSAAVLQKPQKLVLARQNMLSASFDNMGLTFQPFVHQTRESGIHYTLTANLAYAHRVAALCGKLFLLHL